MKRLPSFLILLYIVLSCSPKVTTGKLSDDIVILYDNDVHCAADGYSAMAALKNDMSQKYRYVTLTSSGDFVQGGSLGAASKGMYMTMLVNRVGYDYVTLGNHEFDYGMQRLSTLTSMLDAEVVDCNLVSIPSGERLYSPYDIKSYGGRKVAFVGVSTPYSFVSSTPSYFQDSTGNFIYSLSTDTIYQTIQNSVDNARRDGADYVVLLSHLGTDVAADSINAYTMIASTSGVDVVLDGHSHSLIPSEIRTARDGKEVLITSTGSHFDNIGCLVIPRRGKISSRLIHTSDYSGRDSSVTVLLDSLRMEYGKMGLRQIGSCKALLRATDEDGDWIVRSAESGLGDFCADALRRVLSTDIALLGGGGIRKNLPETDTLTFNDIFSVFPFGNTVAKATITGGELLDLLEYSYSSLPGDFGGFFQVSGLKLDVDITVPSPVVFDSNKVFVGIEDGKRRVGNVMVFDADSLSYIPLNPEKVYTVASSAYTMVQHGDGQKVVSESKVVDLKTADVQVLESYITDVLGGTVPSSYSKSEGRINIIR